jgi:kumamolisin
MAKSSEGTKGKGTRTSGRRSRAKPNPLPIHRSLTRSFLFQPRDVVAAGPGPAGSAWDIPALCAAYNWPTGLAGGGVIAIIEQAGGWIQTDMDQFFPMLGQPLPDLSDVSVDGTQNNPDPAQPQLVAEVTMDIQIAAASYYVATGNAASIRVYWSADIVPAIKKAVEDGCDVCSISWGNAESGWDPNEAQNVVTPAAKAAVDTGMVLFAAAGDNDSDDGTSAPSVDFPASCPYVIGCGGTTKTTTSEVVWNHNPGVPDGHGTGGGYSTLFPLPNWQVGAPNGPGRMVPDIAATADLQTGYNILVQGRLATGGGTSAVAPLYAGLFAAFGRKLGFVTNKLWMNPMCFNDITEGDNGTFRADRGPDPCTGLGSPIGSKIAKLFL